MVGALLVMASPAAIGAAAPSRPASSAVSKVSGSFEAANAYASAQPDYGGTWIDQAGHVPVFQFTGDIDGHQAAIAALLPSDGRFRVDQVQRTWAELIATKYEIAAEIADLRRRGVHIVGIGPDTRNNQVLVGIKGLDAHARRLMLDRWPDVALREDAPGRFDVGSVAASLPPPPTDSAPALTADPAAPATVTPEPSATPFPWPTLAARPEKPPFEPFTPTGSPDATTTRAGVVVELWLSSPTVGQGEWVQAHVRVTNNRTDAIWAPGGCSLPAHVSVDLSQVYAPGIAWEGNAAAFKARAIREHHLLTQGFESMGRGSRTIASGVTVLALVDCGGTGSDVDRLGPGRALDLSFAGTRWTRSTPRTSGSGRCRPATRR